MAFSLIRESDGTGDSGPMSTIYRYNPATGQIERLHESKPKVGYSIMVGSFMARTYALQDYWQTTEITEILEEKDEYVKFKTYSGSIYEWRVI